MLTLLNIYLRTSALFSEKKCVFLYPQFKIYIKTNNSSGAKMNSLYN